MHTEIIKTVILLAILCALAAVAFAHQDNEFEEEEPVCDKCLGTGEVSVMAMVEHGNPGTFADVDTQPCECQLKNDDE